LAQHKKYSKIKRTREIVRILMYYGFNDILVSTPILKIIGEPLARFKKKNKEELTRGAKIRLAFEELGTTFIKLGQILSSRKDLIPEDIVDELSKLQNKVEPFSETESAAIIEKEIGDTIDNVFEYFEYKPVASASISQVHKAILYTGEVVAIKVKRPNIESKIIVDIEIMMWIADLLERHVEEIALLNPKVFLRAFSEQLQRELNFTYEKNNLTRFLNYFKDDEYIKIPKVYKEYSTKNILTMEFIDGVKLTDIANFQDKFDSKFIVSKIADSMLDQIFMINFFHADPHPGNILILENNVVCYLDFGMVGVIPPSLKTALVNIMYSIHSSNFTKLSYSILELCDNKKLTDFDEFNSRIFLFVNNYIDIPISDVNIEQIFNEIISTLREFNLSVSPYFMMVVKSAIVLEGVGRMLDKDFTVIDHLNPLVKRYLKDKITPQGLFKEFKDIVLDYNTVLKNIPADISDIIAMTKTGSMKIVLEHKGLNALAKTLDSLGDRLSYSIVLAALIIASSLIIASKSPPFLYGVPIIGMIGFAVSGIFGIAMIIGRFIKKYIQKK